MYLYKLNTIRNSSKTAKNITKTLQITKCLDRKLRLLYVQRANWFYRAVLGFQVFVSFCLSS